MKKICLLITIIILVLVVSENSLAKKIELYGFTPASLDSIPVFPSGVKPSQKKENVFVRLIVKIDKKGHVKSVKTPDEKDEKYLKYLESYVKSLKFTPALRKGKKQNSLLPIDVVFAKKIYSPIFIFPVLNDTLVVDNSLLEDAFLVNKFQFPKVNLFPSYFSTINLMESSNRYPFLIEKISYENGEISNIENHMSTYDDFLGQVESATLYADIDLPKYKKKDISTDLYLMVSFFSQLSYPSKIFEANNLDSTNILSQKSVRIVNLTTKLLSEPLPKRVPSNVYSFKNISRAFRGEVAVYVRIDTLGNTIVFRDGTSKKKINKSIRKLVSKLKFYPAINQQNELVEFFGYLRLGHTDGPEVRILYLWLE